MKPSERAIAGGPYGKWVLGIIAFAIMAWGYSNYQYPVNLVLIAVGAVMLAGVIIYSLRRRKGE